MSAGRLHPDDERVIQEAIDAFEAGDHDRVSSSCLIVLATESIRIRDELVQARAELDHIGERLHAIGRTLDGSRIWGDLS